MEEPLGIYDFILLLLSGAYSLFFIVQILCLVHVLKEGKEYFWIFVIFFFPFFGCLIYLFVEVLPSLKHHHFVRSLGGAKKASKRELNKLREGVEQSETVENMVLLADAHLSREEYTEASKIYRDCLEGVHKEDTAVLYRLSESLYGEENYQESLELLHQLDDLGYKDYRLDRELQMANCYSHTGDYEKGIAILERIADSCPGEEARYRLGMMYFEMSRMDEARNLFTTIISNRKKYRRATIGNQKNWVSLARKKLKEMGKK